MRPGTDLDGAALRHGLDRVGEQLDEDIAHVVGGSPDGRHLL